MKFARRGRTSSRRVDVAKDRRKHVPHLALFRNGEKEYSPQFKPRARLKRHEAILLDSQTGIPRPGRQFPHFHHPTFPSPSAQVHRSPGSPPMSARLHSSLGDTHWSATPPAYSRTRSQGSGANNPSLAWMGQVGQSRGTFRRWRSRWHRLGRERYYLRHSRRPRTIFWYAFRLLLREFRIDPLSQRLTCWW